jgi:hypothetical protein
MTGNAPGSLPGIGLFSLGLFLPIWAMGLATFAGSSLHAVSQVAEEVAQETPSDALPTHDSSLQAKLEARIEGF